MALDWIALVAYVLLSPSWTEASNVGASSFSATSQCEAESRRLFGEFETSGDARPPRLLHIVQPEVPDLPPGTRGSGVPLHALLIGPDGKVHGIWTVRELTLQPPFPDLDRAIVDAARQWVYTPAKVRGRPVPTCALVTTCINWR
jgi:hypothetical protein